MVRFQPSLGGNDRRLQSQIQRIAGAPLGPVDIRPGEGHVTFYDGDGNVIAAMDQTGVKVRYRGGTNDVSGVLAVKTDYSYVDGNVRTLVEKNNAQDARADTMQADINTRATRVYVDGNIKTLVEKNASQDAVIDTKAARTYVDGNISTLVSKNSSQDSRMDRMDSEIDTKASRSYVDGNVSTLVSKNNSQDDAIAARATRSYVDGNVSTLVDRIDSTQLRVALLENFAIPTLQGRVKALEDRLARLNL